MTRCTLITIIKTGVSSGILNVQTIWYKLQCLADWPMPSSPSYRHIIHKYSAMMIQATIAWIFQFGVSA